MAAAACSLALLLHRVAVGMRVGQGFWLCSSPVWPRARMRSHCLLPIELKLYFCLRVVAYLTPRLAHNNISDGHVQQLYNKAQKTYYKKSHNNDEHRASKFVPIRIRVTLENSG